MALVLAAEPRLLVVLVVSPVFLPLPAFAWLVAAKDAEALRGTCLGLALLLLPYGVLLAVLGGFVYLPSVPLLLLTRWSVRSAAVWWRNVPVLVGLAYTAGVAWLVLSAAQVLTRIP